MPNQNEENVCDICHEYLKELRDEFFEVDFFICPNGCEVDD